MTTACRCCRVKPRPTQGALQDARLLASHRGRAIRGCDPDEVIEETLAARNSERQGRLIDAPESGGGMERKKQEGYF